MNDEMLGFETLAIHAGQDPDPQTGAVVPPIYQASTYKQDGVGGLRGRLRVLPHRQPDQDAPSRTAWPRWRAAAAALAFASGMAAEDCLLRTRVRARRPRAHPR